MPQPDPSDVDHIIFMVGDAGDANRETFPIMRRLEQDVEWWAGQLARDSAVVVLYLGDIVYPRGLNTRDHESFASDSTIVADQVRLVEGENALRYNALGYFMAGNHDWGLEPDWEGFDRLKRLDNFLGNAAAATGVDVALVPQAGSGGPYVLDLGDHSRLLMLDTAWWLLDGGRLFGPQREDMLDGIEEAMATAGDRHVFIAAHHPFRSAGPHGGEVDFWKTLGIRYILARSGALLQDITSVPYRELEAGLREIFARQGAPLAFLGGHDHSLQVLGAIEDDEPEFTLVSGAASKISAVGRAEAMYFGRSGPGYIRVIVERDGGVTAFVESAPLEFHSCSGSEEQIRECMIEGVEAYEIVHSQRLR